MQQQQNTGKYALNINNMLVMLLPFSLRKMVIINLLYCMLEPLRRMYADFTKFREEKEYRMSHSGQVCSLEDVLNDAITPRPHIYITDGVYVQATMIPADGSSDYASYQVYINPDSTENEPHLYIGTHEEFAGGYDFIIHVPAALRSDTDVMNKLRSLADTYKLAGKIYGIEFY